MTLLARARNDFQLDQANRSLKAIVSGLDVKVETIGTNPRGWIQISVSGQDEEVALTYLHDEIGFCPIELRKVALFTTFKGFIRDAGQNRSELVVDVGISDPKTIDAIVPLDRLQAQIGDGRKIALSKLSQLFGLRENLPLYLRVTRVEQNEERIVAELSDEQLRIFRGWTSSLLDRLLIVGASHSEVKLAVKRSSIFRDVINVEPLGMFEHAIVCKLGTDAAGIIPKIGKLLKKATFTVHSPRSIVKLFGAETAATV